MTIDPALLSPVSALLGGLLGGGASLIAAIHTQRGKDRLQRVAAEITKRETVYADFVMHASNLLLNAYVSDEMSLGDDEQRLIGLINRMRLFAPAHVIAEAEAVERIEPAQVDQLLRAQFDPVARQNAVRIARGLNASPGAAVGKAVFDADTAVEWVEKLSLIHI